MIISFVFVFGYKNPHCVEGRHAIVHLFEWKWEDIAAECERFLGPYSFCGVQTSPASENRVVSKRPWFERYQPVSYKLITRSGTEKQFKDMVERCNAQGDALINHMSRMGSIGTGTGGNFFDTDNFYFPGVPFGATDFNERSCCPTWDGRIHGYQNAVEIRRQNALKWLKNFDADKGMWSSGDLVNFIDNHDNQRGHGSGEGVLTHSENPPYKVSTFGHSLHTYGIARIMSSYEYNHDDNSEGPPHNCSVATGGRLNTAGQYCDVISGNLANGSCTGASVIVEGSGEANIHVCLNCEDPMLAIHIGK
ncbi:alpha-amylase [Plakobranchus ocellatus]|uniref:Alpha-amylase n=1 Tax=Plakobranchus ocellatus TaxID=259542 RepID=A0AAV3Y5M3_9GAST|nr:alpha-amylase [Plakobranchus ocellatus]